MSALQISLILLGIELYLFRSICLRIFDSMIDKNGIDSLLSIMGKNISGIFTNDIYRMSLVS